MIKLDRILVPTDFSDFSRPAMQYGCAMAARFGAELHLLHVVPDPAMLVPEAAAFSVETMQAQSESLVRSALETLQKLPPDNWENEKPVVREVRVGAAFMEIIDYARDNEIDLIVIGTHGRSGLMHVLMGSVAERIVRKAPCPVLTVKPEGHQFVMP
jgi:universal stress protein A